MKVPAFLLRRLYVKGSLHNVDGGFEFQLKNSLGSGYAEKTLPLVVDEVEIPAEDAAFVQDGQVLPFTAVTPENTVTLGMNQVSTVRVTNRTLEAGKHKLVIGFIVTGMGELRFDVNDVVA